MSSQLAYLLTHQLANDDAASLSGPSTSTLLHPAHLVQSLQLVKQAESEGNAGEKAASTLHRWNLRLTSLVNSKIRNAQATGFSLALETSHQSQSIFLAHSKAWYSAALTILAKKAIALPSLSLHATEFLLFCFAQAARLPEYAREVANPAGVRKLGDALLQIAGNESADLSARMHAVNALTNLIRISASPLRPIAPQMQALSVHLLCQWASDPSLFSAKQSASKLLANVYITAGKAQIAQSWRRTVESLLGSAQLCFDPLVSTFIEDYSSSTRLPPLEMPPIASTSASVSGHINSLQASYERLQVVLDVLLTLLAAPTERAVAIPLGALVQFVQRILSVTIYSPTKERHDANLHLAQLALLPSLHLQACRLLGQVAVSTGIHLTSYSSQLLAHLSFVHGTYGHTSALRSSFYATTALLVSSVRPHPDEASKSLSKLVRGILEDAALLVDDTPAKQKSASNGGAGGHDPESGMRKNKKARLFESDQTMTSSKGIRMEDVACVVHSLNSLQRILQSAAYLLSPQVLNLTLRLLLAYALSPSFLSTQPISFSSHSDLLSNAICLYPSLRSSTLRCLSTCIQNSLKEAPGYLDHALNAFRMVLQSSEGMSEEEKSIAREAILNMDLVARPVVPPVLKTRGMRSAMVELVGGSVDKRAMKPDADQQNQDATAEDEEELRRKQPANSAFGGLGSFGTEPQEIPTTSTQYFKPVNQPALASAPAKPAPQSTNFQQIGATTTTVPLGRVGQEARQQASLDKLPSPTVPTSAVRPPPPPIEAIDAAAPSAEPAIAVPVDEDRGMDTEEPDQEEAVLEEDISMRAEMQAPFARTGAGEEDDSDSDPDAPLPKIVLDDSDDE